LFNGNYYKADKKEIEYFTKVFSESILDSYLRTEREDFTLYIPLQNKKKKTFILILTKEQRYGKFGS